MRGTAVNHGGRAASLTAPNPEAQAQVLIRAYRDAGVDPRDVSAIEAHGTGTRLGRTAWAIPLAVWACTGMSCMRSRSA
ncbi:hypothetical protein ABZZ80_43675 [Streptomyces sp. NPDC006356]